MKKVIIGSLSVLLLACGGSATEVDSNESTDENNNEALDTTTVDSTVVDENIEESVYNTIEDYGQIKTKEELINIFGEENLVDGESWYAEGEVRFDHTVLTNPDNGHVIKYLWNRDDTNVLSSIEAYNYIINDNYEILGVQSIESECGIRTGMSIEELKEWNGADFRFSGFGWDYEGGISAEAGSTIAECPVQIKLSFDLDIEVSDEYKPMYSDSEFNTADEIVQGAPIIVDLLTFYPQD